MFMDGTRGDLTRLLMNLGGGNLLSKAISNGDILGLLKLLATDETARDILMKILPDSAKAFMVFGVLVCIACTIACAALEKPGVFLELFAYGYTLIAGPFAAKESALMGAILGIAAGALLGALGYKISRGWIIVVPNLFDFGVVAIAALLVPSSAGGNGFAVFISLISLALLVAIPIGVYKQFKATAIPKDGTAQSAAAASGLRGKWAEKFKTVTNFVPAMPSAQSKANPTLRNTPPGGQKFCSKCGNSLAPGAKFCAKCGAPTQSGEDAAKPM